MKMENKAIAIRDLLFGTWKKMRKCIYRLPTNWNLANTKIRLKSNFIAKRDLPGNEKVQLYATYKLIFVRNEIKMKMKSKSKVIRNLLFGTWTRFKMRFYKRPKNWHSMKNKNENENENL